MRTENIANFGLAVHGFTGSPGECDELAKHFRRERWLVLRSERARDLQELKKIARIFGSVLGNAAEDRFRIDSDGEIIRVSNSKDERGEADGLFGNHDLEWHNDFAHSPGEFHGTLLYNHDGGGLADFWLCDTHSACAQLSSEEKHELNGVIGLHAPGVKAYRDVKPSAAELRLLRAKAFKIAKSDYSHYCAHEIPTERALISLDGEGRESLYLSPATLIGTEPAVERSVLDRLLAHCERPEFVRKHRWLPYDTLIFDNRTTMHRRGPFQGSRVLYRMQFQPAGAHA